MLVATIVKLRNALIDVSGWHPIFVKDLCLLSLPSHTSLKDAAKDSGIMGNVPLLDEAGSVVYT
jgi:hypothetical protein